MRPSLDGPTVQSQARKMAPLLGFYRVAEPSGERIRDGALAEGVGFELPVRFLGHRQATAMTMRVTPTR